VEGLKRERARKTFEYRAEGAADTLSELGKKGWSKRGGKPGAKDPCDWSDPSGGEGGVGFRGTGSKKI